MEVFEDKNREHQIENLFLEFWTAHLQSSKILDLKLESNKTKPIK